MLISRQLSCLLGLLVCLGTAAQAQQVHIKRTYYDFQGRQLHEEFQYVSTPTNRYSKSGYYKEYNQDGTLWRKQNFRNNKTEGRQLEYETTGGETWVKYDMMVRNNLMNGPYIRYGAPNQKMAAGNYVNGEQSGRWTFYYPEGYEVCTYEDNEKEGPATLYWKSGKVSDHYLYRRGEKYNADGDINTFYEDGKPHKRGHFTDGKMNGRFLAWYPNGQLRYDETYVAGSREGRFLGFAQNGDTLTDDSYRDNTMYRHRQSSGEVAAAAAKAQEDAQRRQQDSLRQAQNQALVAQRAQEAQAQLADKLVAEAQRKQHSLALAAAETTSSLNTNTISGTAGSLLSMAAARKPQKKLYYDLFAQLSGEYEKATTVADKLTKAQRLLALMNLAEALYQGQQPDLNKAIRKENDLGKVLALTGL